MIAAFGSGIPKPSPVAGRIIDIVAVPIVGCRSTASNFCQRTSRCVENRDGERPKLKAGTFRNDLDGHSPDSGVTAVASQVQNQTESTRLCRAIGIAVLINDSRLLSGGCNCAQRRKHKQLQRTHFMKSQALLEDLIITYYCAH